MYRTCPTCGTRHAALNEHEQCPFCLLRIGLEEGLAAEDALAEDDPVHTVIIPAASAPTESGVSQGKPLGPIELGQGQSSGRLTLQEEIARGGAGVILRAYDAALGREVAVKVLQARHRERDDLAARFIEEARISGQLQHPGIVPVYELGMLPDQRPYFAMKLVKGRTLARLLAERTLDGAGMPSDRAALLRVFLRLAETLAYVHERGVVHLDIKPENVMVGKHGEVQLMDWGLACQPAGPAEASRAAHASPQSGSAGRGGTPPYMAPERFQDGARRPDVRSDVFALGAILFEILAGSRLYAEENPELLRALAAACDTRDGLRRLEEQRVDPELVELTRACISRDPAQRPCNAGVCADRLTAFFESAEQRARHAELSRARAEEAAAGERKRRRWIGVSAAFGVGMAVVVSLWLLAAARQRDAVAASRALALQEIRNVVDRAAEDPAGDPDLWENAREVADRLTPPADAATEQSADAFAALNRTVAAGLARAHADQELVAALERARADADYGDYIGALAGIESAFVGAGLDVRSDPELVGRAIADRPPHVRTELVAALDIWSALVFKPEVIPAPLRGPTINEDHAAQLWENILLAVKGADADAWRNNLRDAFYANDQEGLSNLLSDTESVAEQPAVSTWLAGKLLYWSLRRTDAISLLEAARSQHLDDFWIHHELAVRLDNPRVDPAAALNYATAAVSLRPQSRIARVRRGMVLATLGRIDEAEAELRGVIRESPEYGPAYYRLANLLNFNTTRYDEAVELYAAAERLEPVRAQAARVAMTDALLRLQRGMEAVPVAERAVQSAPEDLVALCLLARSYVTQRRLADASELLPRISALKPETDNEAGLVHQVRTELRRLEVLMGAARMADLEPLDAAERLALAEMCTVVHWPAAAARLYRTAMAEDPVLAADQERYVRYTAAQLAVEAAADGAGVGRPLLTAAEREELLDQALNWLLADLDVQRERLRSTDAGQQQCAVEWLEFIMNDAAFEPVRPENLSDETRRAAWREFWQEVEALRP